MAKCFRWKESNFVCEIVDDMHRTLQLMDFYKKTDDRIVFASIHDGVLQIQNQVKQV